MTKINLFLLFVNPVPRHTVLMIYKSKISPVSDYGNIIYDNCCDGDKRMLDKAQIRRYNNFNMS